MQLKQPRLAEMVAASLRNDILAGELKEGDSLPRQEHLIERFRVSLPAVREAMRILETEGLISVRRGNVGGAIVHLPSSSAAARMISMVLQVRKTTLDDVSGALLHMEPVCAGMCAAREDRETEVVPFLREALEAQKESFDDWATWTPLARRFHDALIERSGNETMKVLIGSLGSIWSAHESTVWADATMVNQYLEDPTHSPMARKTRQAAYRDHERLLAAIETGQVDKAIRVASAHLAATRSTTLASSATDFVNANLISSVDLS
ncbi:FadR/GntR family transcriptional regulator [Microbacterium sp. A588]